MGRITGSRCGFDPASAPAQNIAVLIGDSIVSNMYGNAFNVLRPVGKVLIKQATAGDEIVDEYNRWLVSEYRGDVRVKWIYVQCGINNIVHGSYTDAQIVAQMSTLISDIQTHNPNAHIFLQKMDPCKTYLGTIGAGRYPQWQNVDALMATTFGALYLTAVSDNINDGFDDAKVVYGGPGLLHPNSTADVDSANILLTEAQALPGGWS